MIGDYAKTDVVKAFPTTPIREVAKLMAERRVGLVVLVDPRQQDRVVGVVSERDVVKAVAFDADLNSPVDTIATKNVVTLDYGENVAKAAEVFKKYGIRHVVVTKDGRLYGVLSIRDIIREEAILREVAEYYEWTFEPGMSA
ncbi:CBS domain-containing protein [Pyrobaculum sp. 3827-6]|jgi:CBS domain-containing protein|uniref:CBS domain-containing protein n=1 Tax=Pyrobaculum sp. 3827-6 TaxID=2983604 RepID=UPI0021D7EB2B|nr:CBS domain-containing protein [Pyrobaculum sp. 3827-6]MCU7788317.1 CBS domain-containing protein [Pyrobaculum sp. 3827-6]